MSSNEVVVILQLPNGAVGAFAIKEIEAARSRAADLGFQAPATTATPPPTERLMDSKGLGALLGCNDTLCEAMARDGRLPSVRIGKLLRFEPAACVAALRASDAR